MTAERVYQLRALPDQKIPRPEQHGARLLSLALNRDKAHRWSTGSLSDRFRVGCIILLALDERFDVGGWDQSNLMPEVTDGPTPVVRAPTGFHGDDAARLLGKEAENFLSGKLFAETNTAVGKGAMRLEGPLCKIETDNANLFHGCLSVRGMRKHHHLGTSRCRQEGHPLHHSTLATTWRGLFQLCACSASWRNNAAPRKAASQPGASANVRSCSARLGWQEAGSCSLHLRIQEARRPRDWRKRHRPGNTDASRCLDNARSPAPASRASRQHCGRCPAS